MERMEKIEQTLQLILSKLEGLETGVKEVKQDLAQVKQDITVIKQIFRRI